MIKLPAFACLALLISACANSPAKVYQATAEKLGLAHSLVSTKSFDLTVFSNQKSVSRDQALHIYIEGDGQPFIRGRYINKDPTSRRAVALKLLAKDSNPALLLGRPCYHQYYNQVDSRGCDSNKWWTSHRYGQDVIDAMAEAVMQLNQEQQRVVLIGHSGGGALAMLLANRLAGVASVVTISGNLDVRAWTKQHAYTPLFGSLNPIDQLAPVADIKQLHLVGANDKNIPYDAWQAKVAKPQASTVNIFPDFTHNCCWEKIWPGILEQLE